MAVSFAWVSAIASHCYLHLRHITGPNPAVTIYCLGSPEGCPQASRAVPGDVYTGRGEERQNVERIKDIRTRRVHSSTVSEILWTARIISKGQKVEETERISYTKALRECIPPPRL